MSSVNAEFNPTFGIFQQSEIVDSLCSSATFWQTSEQVKVTQAQCRGMPSLDPWAGKSKNGKKNLFCTIVVCKSKHFFREPTKIMIKMKMCEFVQTLVSTAKGLKTVSCAQISDKVLWAIRLSDRRLAHNMES